MQRIRLASMAVLAVGGLLAGCGSSNSSSSSSSSSGGSKTATTGGTTAATANATPIRGVASPASAVKPSPSVLKQLKKVPKGNGVTSAIGGLTKLPLEKQISTLDGDLNTFWSKEFANSNVQWPQAQEAFVASSPVQTQCSAHPTLAPTDPWFLCDPTFYWTLPWIQQNIQPKGDVTLSFGVGLFWSFHVQFVIGQTDQMQKGQITKGQWANSTLCWTGLWVRSLAQRNLFEQGDTQALQSIINDLQGIGGVGPPDVTQQSLAKAFVNAYNSGDPAQCSGGSSGGGGGQSTTPTDTTSTPTDTTSTPTSTSTGPTGL